MAAYAERDSKRGNELQGVPDTLKDEKKHKTNHPGGAANVGTRRMHKFGLFSKMGERVPSWGRQNFGAGIVHTDPK